MAEPDRPDFDRGLNIRTTARAQRAINRVVASVKASDRVRFRGRAATKEAVINATWLYLDSLPEPEVERIMAEFVPKLEAMLGGEGG